MCRGVGDESECREEEEEEETRSGKEREGKGMKSAVQRKKGGKREQKIDMMWHPRGREARKNGVSQGDGYGEGTGTATIWH